MDFSGLNYRFCTSDSSGVIPVYAYKLPPFRGSECVSITDKSQFVPSAEAVKRAGALGTVGDAGTYDFQPGQDDDGRKVPVARIRGVDIAELQAEIEAQSADIEGQVKKAQRRAEVEAALEASASVPSNETSQTSSNAGA